MTNPQAGKTSIVSAARRRQPTGDHHPVGVNINTTEAVAQAASTGAILPTAAKVAQSRANARVDDNATTGDPLIDRDCPESLGDIVVSVARAVGRVFGSSSVFDFVPVSPATAIRAQPP